MLKRVCSFAIAFAMLLSMACVMAFADSPITPTIEADKTQAMRGDTVVLTIGIKDYVPLEGIEMEVGFDADVFTGATVASKQGRNPYFDAEPAPLITVNAGKNPVYVSFASAEAMTAFGADGNETTTPTMFKVTLTVKDDAAFANTTVFARFKSIVPGTNAYTTENQELTISIVEFICDHEAVEIPAVPATCTEPGATAGSKCSICNTILIAPVVIPATGHTPVDIEGTPATCTATGLTAGKKCSVCNEILVAQTVIDKTAHTPADAVQEDVVPATCSAAGSYNEVVYCSACNTKLSTTPRTIEKLAHTPVDIEATPATCTATGLTAGKKCSVCNEILVAQTVIDKIAHTPADAVQEDVVPATCTAAGSYNEVVYCSACNTKLSTTPRTIEKLAHTPVDLLAVPATCTATGLTAGKKCSVCNEILVAQTVIDKIAHTPGEAQEEDYVPATCVDAGSYAMVVRCTVCGEELSRETYTIDASGDEHDDVNLYYVAPTTTESGAWISYCDACHTELYRQEIEPITVKDLDEDAWYTEDAIYAMACGFFYGDQNGNLNATKNLTRAEVATILSRYWFGTDFSDFSDDDFEEAIADIQESYGNTNVIEFTDISGKWYERAAIAMMSAGYINGCENNTFCGEREITREELVTILYRILGEDVTDAYYGPSATFSDMADVSSWAVEAVTWAGQTGLFQGAYGKFNPKSKTTRAEAMTLMTRVDRADRELIDGDPNVA